VRQRDYFLDVGYGYSAIIQFLRKRSPKEENGVVKRGKTLRGETCSLQSVLLVLKAR
jgi:hypothetical protein